MTRLAPPAPIVALLYADGHAADRVLRAVADRLIARGLDLAGVVQEDGARDAAGRCDMALVELSSGKRFPISEPRGRAARGCRLDLDALARASLAAEGAIGPAIDLVIVNKFGRAEIEGGGFRAVFAAALTAGVPILAAVPWRNLDAWRVFSGGLSSDRDLTDLPQGAEALCRSLGLGRPSGEPDETANMSGARP
jgi:nucleoside-triphosphatase THEP1